MNKAELRRQIAHKGLSQVKMARAIGIADRTMRAYCLGEDPIPGPVELAVRYVVEHMSDDELERRLGHANERGRMDDGRRSRYR